MEDGIELQERGNQSKTSRSSSDLSGYQVDASRVYTEIHYSYPYIFSDEDPDEETYQNQNGLLNLWGIIPKPGNRRALSEGAYSPRSPSSRGSISFERSDERQKKRRMSTQSAPLGNHMDIEELGNSFNNAPVENPIQAAKKTHAPKYACCGLSVFLLALIFLLRESSEHTPIPALLNIAIKETGRASSSSGYIWSFIASIDAAPVNQSVCLIFNNFTSLLNSSHITESFSIPCRSTDKSLPEKIQGFTTPSNTCGPSILNQALIPVISNWTKPLSCTDSPTPTPDPFIWIYLGELESNEFIPVSAWSNSTHPPRDASIHLRGITEEQGIIINEVWTWVELLSNRSRFFLQQRPTGPITFFGDGSEQFSPNPYPVSGPLSTKPAFSHNKYITTSEGIIFILLGLLIIKGLLDLYSYLKSICDRSNAPVDSVRNQPFQV